MLPGEYYETLVLFVVYYFVLKMLNFFIYRNKMYERRARIFFQSKNVIYTVLV